MIKIVKVEACPVADGGAPCCRNCGGGWPGTRSTSEQLTAAVEKRKIDPKKLGCELLQQRVAEALKS